MFLPPWGVCSWPRLRKNDWLGGVQTFLHPHPAGSCVLSLPVRALQLKGHIAIELSVRVGAWRAPGGTLVGRKEKWIAPRQGWVSWHGVLAVPALLVPLRLSFGLRLVWICQAVWMQNFNNLLLFLAWHLWKVFYLFPFCVKLELSGWTL